MVPKVRKIKIAQFPQFNSFAEENNLGVDISIIETLNIKLYFIRK